MAVLVVAVVALAAALALAARPTAAATAPVAPAQPTATPTPVTLTGTLLASDGGPCAQQATLVVCDIGTRIPVRADWDLSAYIDRVVRIEGSEEMCPDGENHYVWLTGIEPQPDGCAPATPSPEPTPAPGENLALGAPVQTASMGASSSHLTDGDLGTTAVSAGGGAEWVILDLGERRTFNAMTMHWDTPFAVDYYFYVFRNEQWYGIYRHEDGDGGVDRITMPRIYERYVLLYMVTSSAPNQRFALREWEVFGHDTPNLALEQQVYVSGSQPGFPGPQSVDGRYDTEWRSLGDAYSRHWIRLHLPPQSSMSEMRLYWSETAFPWVYTFIIYRDGNGLPFVYDARSGPGGGLHVVSDNIARYTDAILIWARLLSDPGYMALEEFEVYNPGLYPPDLSGVNGTVWRALQWGRPDRLLRDRPVVRLGMEDFRAADETALEARGLPRALAAPGNGNRQLPHDPRIPVVPDGVPAP